MLWACIVVPSPLCHPVLDWRPVLLLQTDLALLENVSLVSIDAMGAVLELLICVPSEDSCIAILERLPWPEATTCTCVDDVVTAFGAMSVGVGLSGDI